MPYSISMLAPVASAACLRPCTRPNARRPATATATKVSDASGELGRAKSTRMAEGLTPTASRRSLAVSLPLAAAAAAAAATLGKAVLVSSATPVLYALATKI